MKKLVLIALALTLITSLAYAQFTTDQEDKLKIIANNFDKLADLVAVSQQLKDVADNLGLETIPLQIKVLREEIVALIATRDAEITDVKVAAQAQIQSLMDTYEVQIDAKEAEINALNNQLNP